MPKGKPHKWGSGQMAKWPLQATGRDQNDPPPRRWRGKLCISGRGAKEPMGNCREERQQRVALLTTTNTTGLRISQKGGQNHTKHEGKCASKADMQSVPLGEAAMGPRLLPPQSQ